MIYCFVARLKRNLFFLLSLNCLALPIGAQNNQNLIPMLNYRQKFQAEDEASAFNAMNNAQAVRGQPTRQEGDITSAQTDKVAKLAQEWLERVEFDIINHKDWQSDRIEANKVITVAAQWARQTAKASRVNGENYGGKIKEINFQAANNCDAAAAIAERAVAGESNWSQAQSAADNFAEFGQQAIQMGFPVAGHESIAAASIARIAIKMIHINSSIHSLETQAKLSNPNYSTKTKAKILQPNSAQFQNLPQASEKVTGKILDDKNLTPAKSAQFNNLPQASKNVTGKVLDDENLTPAK